MTHFTLGVIGAGNMGQAIIAGVIRAGVVSASRVVVADRRNEPLDALKQQLGVHTTASNVDLIERCDVILIAVKPQGFQDLMSSTAGTWRKNQVVLSVVAGVTTQTIELGINVAAPVIRVMPNTPALVGQGMSAYCCGQYAQEEHAQIAAQLFDCVGQSVQVEESLIDPITATSGSGPAYIFYLVEAMQKAAESLGIPPELAETLVQQTVYGAATLLKGSDQPANQLRANVTSAGGTTAAALSQLEDGDLEGLMAQAMSAADARAKELGKA